MELKGKRFLVIGGAGLIGSHVVEELLKEEVAEVLIYDNFTRGRLENLSVALQDPRAKVFPVGGDIMHRDILQEAMKGVDGVFHLAALWLLHCWDFPRSAFDVNIAGTFNVIEACIQSDDVKRLVYSSSASVYGDALSEPMEEDHPYNNTTFYGASKIAGEHMCRSLYHRYKDTDRAFDYVGMRYMNVYGPRQDYRGAYIAVIMKMLDRIDRGLPPVVYGDGSQAYDFIFVRDCARANVCAMKSDATDQFYNVGRGIKTTIKELAELVLELTNPSLEIEYNPAGQSFVKNRIGSTVNAKRDLSFEAKTELREGLQQLIQWRNEHKAEVEARQREASVQY
jgi:UDP-glucose 4-epimerase